MPFRTRNKTVELIYGIRERRRCSIQIGYDKRIAGGRRTLLSRSGIGGGCVNDLQVLRPATTPIEGKVLV